MEEVSVQFLQCLLKDGVGGRSRKTESMEEKWCKRKLSNEVSVAESRVELEAQEDKKSWEWEVWRSSEGRGLGWYHIAKIDKFIK